MDISEDVLADLAGVVAAAMPPVVARVPAAPAAELGRLRAAADGTAPPTVRPGGMPRRAVPAWAGAPRATGESPVREALAALPSLLAERLLGALELTVPELDLTGVPDLGGLLGEPSTDRFLVARIGGDSEAVTGLAMLDQVRPGAVPLVAATARRLASHPRLAPLLAERTPTTPPASGPSSSPRSRTGTVESASTDEAAIAGAHGARHLALALATAAAVLRGLAVKPWAATPPAVVGVAIGVAVLLLREAPMPAGYAAAVLERVRAEYLMPRRSAGQAPVSGHRLALLDGTDVPAVDFGGNGLVAVVPGGAVIRTGVGTGTVGVRLTVLDAPPPQVATGWSEIVEVSWQAGPTGAAVLGYRTGGRGMNQTTPPWPGSYRLRVHAHGRDEVEDPGAEQYELMVWAAPDGPEMVHARADRLGHRLRGEPEPPRPDRPEAAYRWLRNGPLEMAATITVVTGSDAAQVLHAFGADPDRPESARDIADDLMSRQSIDPWVQVLDLGGAVVAVEYNGWQGSTGPVLLRASAGGRAASMFWNVNAVTRLSFAERGRVLLSEEPFGELAAPPTLAATLDGLDFGDLSRNKRLLGMVAVQRFTGRGVTADDVARLEAADLGFRILTD